MKKLLVFLLCTVMALSMMAPAFAADEKNLLELDFEALPEGNISRPADKMYSSHPKTGTIKVVTVDGNKVMEVARSAEKADPYFDLFYVNGTTATLQSAQGASQQIVLEYDLYIKAACDAMQWSIGISKEYPASLGGETVAWGDTGVILGDLGLYKYADIKADPRPAPLFKFELKKWYKVAVAIDSAKDTYSLFVDGKMVIEGVESTVKAKDAESPSVLRINYRTVTPAGEAAMYVDNIKVYDGTQPRGYVAPAVTEKPAATTTPKAPQTFDAGIIAIVTAAASLSTAVVLKKKR